MTIAGALAITGAIFTVSAIVIGAVASNPYSRVGRWVPIVAWVAFALAVGIFISATWTALLT